MFNKIKNLFKPAPKTPWSEVVKQTQNEKFAPPEVTPPKVKERQVRSKPKKAEAPALSAKDRATAAGEPYVSVLGMEVDPNNINNGAFELDFNPIFVARLVKAGYMKRKEDTDNVIVDRWFYEVCRNIVLEMYEQSVADPDNREPPPLTKPITEVPPRVITQKPLDNGRSEIS